MKTDVTTAITAVAVLAVVGLVLYATRQAGQGVAAVAQAFNPLSDQNLAYKAANGIVSAATGRDETLGGWWADTFSSNGDAVKEMLTPRNPAAPQISTPSGFADVVSNNSDGMNYNYF